MYIRRASCEMRNPSDTSIWPVILGRVVISYVTLSLFLCAVVSSYYIIHKHYNYYNMFICMCLYMCLFTTQTFACMALSAYVAYTPETHTHVHARTHTYTHTHTHMCMYVCSVCIHTHICVHMYVHAMLAALLLL